MGEPLCLLSVDLEAWSDAALAGVPEEARDRSDDGLEEASDRLLDLLDEFSARATFFTLGRVARRHPALVRRIARRHEIASHGDAHTDLRRLDARRLGDDLARARARLQDLSGQPVDGYRAPNFSLGACLSWALPVLSEQGVRFDSSLLPGAGFLFLPGSARASRRPHLLEGSRIREFPPTVVRLPGVSLPAAGGAFLRLLPRTWVLRVLDAAVRRQETPHVHLHPWEIAPPAAGPARLRSALLFARSQSVLVKLRAILSRFQGIAIGDYSLAMPLPRPAADRPGGVRPAAAQGAA